LAAYSIAIAFLEEKENSFSSQLRSIYKLARHKLADVVEA
jgi:hypothetical protein